MEKPPVKAKTVSLVAAPAAVIKELPVKKINTPTKNPEDFNWEEIISIVKEKQIALSGIVAKCKHEFTPKNNNHVLYTATKFNKKKLDSPKYLSKLYEILAEAGFSEITIETVPSGPPLKGDLERIADIMGGGESVEVNI